MTFLFQWGHATWKKFVTTLLKELSHGCWLCRPKPYRVKGERSECPRAQRSPQGLGYARSLRCPAPPARAAGPV